MGLGVPVKSRMLVSAGLLISCAIGQEYQHTDEITPPPGSGKPDTDTSEDTEGFCSTVIRAVVRDFNESHPDFERPDSGWGPARGLIESRLTADRKPIYRKIRGDCQLLSNGTCMPTANWGNTPMWGIETDTGWTAEETFLTWYRDNADFPDGFDWYPGDTLNMTYLRDLHLIPRPDAPGVQVFDSNAFFPLGMDEGFGETPPGSGANFLFTTEIHVLFAYRAGQVFTFRGDDDLWIFVNGRLALDLGGLHEPVEGVIDFDAQASALGISVGGIYHMDIFHAERHTTESNFRIETNIPCFIQVPIE